MRPRIRTIKPELFKDQKLQRRTRDERLLFIGLFSHADDDGRIEGDVALIRSVVFPCDDLSLPKVDRWLQNLADYGFIRRYTAEGQPYIDIPTFPTHQRIDKPTKSPIPHFDARDQTTNGKP